jgi:hypothetical protein
MCLRVGISLLTTAVPPVSPSVDLDLTLYDFRAEEQTEQEDGPKGRNCSSIEQYGQ